MPSSATRHFVGLFHKCWRYLNSKVKKRDMNSQWTNYLTMKWVTKKAKMACTFKLIVENVKKFISNFCLTVRIWLKTTSFSKCCDTTTMKRFFPCDWCVASLCTTLDSLKVGIWLFSWQAKIHQSKEYCLKNVNTFVSVKT